MTETAADPTRLADCLKLLAEPKDLPDTHKAIAYLLHHKHRHAIVSFVVVQAGTPRIDRLTKRPPEDKPTIRRWEILPGYTTEQVEAARCRGRVEAAHIDATLDRKDWKAALDKIEHPLVRDTTADVLRGWW